MPPACSDASGENAREALGEIVAFRDRTVREEHPPVTEQADPSAS